MRIERHREYRKGELAGGNSLKLGKKRAYWHNAPLGSRLEIHEIEAIAYTAWHGNKSKDKRCLADRAEQGIDFLEEVATDVIRERGERL